MRKNKADTPLTLPITILFYGDNKIDLHKKYHKIQFIWYSFSPLKA